MQKTLIAFDVDGTLRSNLMANGGLEDRVVANEDIRTLLITLSKFKNVKILVWSGGGEWYARDVVNALGLKKYVNYYADKKMKRTGKVDEDGLAEIVEFHPDFKPDIAIDDIQSCELGLINLIVREKWTSINATFAGI